MVNRTSIDSASSGSMPAAPPADRRTRWRLYVFLVVLLALLGWFGRFAWLRITLKPTPRPEYWAAELLKHFPSPPDGVPLQEVKRVATTCDSTRSYNFRSRWRVQLEYLRQQPWIQIFELGAMFQTSGFETKRALILDMLNKPWAACSALDVQEHAFDGWWWRVVQGWHPILLNHAEWCLMNKRMPEASRDILGAFQLFQHQLDQPIPMSHADARRGQTDIAQYIVFASSRRVHRFSCDREFLAQVDKLMGDPPSPREICLFAEMADLARLERFYTREHGGWLDVSKAAKEGRIAWATVEPSSWWNLASPLFHSFETAQEEIHRRYSRIAEDDLNADELEAVRTFQLGPLFGNIDKNNPNAMSQAIELIEYTKYSYSWMNAALAACAVECYQQEHGMLPDTLQQLVPSLLPRIPFDFISRQPVVYHRNSDSPVGFELWLFANSPHSGDSRNGLLVFPFDRWR